MAENFFRRLKREETRHHTDGMYELLRKLQSMVDSCQFTNFREPKKYLDTIDLESKEASKILNLTDSHIRRIRANLSHDAYNYFGIDIFDDIDNEDVNAVLNRLNNASLRLSDKLILSEIRNRIPRDAGAGVSVRDCAKEIKYLQHYCLTSIMDEYEDMDIRHLSKLMSILDGPSDDIRDNLIKTLTRK